MRATAGEDGDRFIASAPSPEAVQAVRQEAEAVRRELQAAALNQLLAQSGIALALMAVVSIGLGWLVAGRVLRPLSAITATARRLEGSTLHERINLQGPQDELKELADTFDQMLGRLDAAFETQRRFVANASHELRTPLAIARTEVDVALADPATGPAELRAMAERVLEANQRSERLIEGLLTLARSERQLRAAEPVDLAVAAADALELAAPRGRAARPAGQPGAGRGPGGRRPRPARAAGRQPGRERRPPQPARRPGRGRHRPRRPPGRGPGRQHRPPDPPRPGRHPVRALPPPGARPHRLRPRRRPRPLHRPLGRHRPRRPRHRHGPPRRGAGGDR